MPNKSAQTARFLQCMECLPVPRVPEDQQWSYEFKLDGYRLESVKSAGKITLYSRRQNVLDKNSPTSQPSLRACLMKP
jgi:ATP-dependent DNA ligase